MEGYTRKLGIVHGIVVSDVKKSSKMEVAPLNINELSRWNHSLEHLLTQFSQNIDPTSNMSRWKDNSAVCTKTEAGPKWKPGSHQSSWLTRTHWLTDSPTSILERLVTQKWPTLLLRRLLITTLLDWDVYIVIIPFNNVVIPIRHMDVLGFRSPQPLKGEKNKGCKHQLRFCVYSPPSKSKYRVTIHICCCCYWAKFC